MQTLLSLGRISKQHSAGDYLMSPDLLIAHTVKLPFEIKFHPCLRKPFKKSSVLTCLTGSCRLDMLTQLNRVKEIFYQLAMDNGCEGTALIPYAGVRRHKADGPSHGACICRSELISAAGPLSSEPLLVGCYITDSSAGGETGRAVKTHEPQTWIHGGHLTARDKLMKTLVNLNDHSNITATLANLF